MHMDQQDLEMIKEARLIDLEKSRFAVRVHPAGDHLLRNRLHN